MFRFSGIVKACQKASNPLINNQIVKYQNYFELLLNHKPSYFVNQSQLKHNFIALQKIVHPDKHAHETGQLIADMHAFSAEINDAYDTLKHPRKRLAYLCSLHKGEQKDVTVLSYIAQKQIEWSNSFDYDGITGLRFSIHEIKSLIQEYETELVNLMVVMDKLNDTQWKRIIEIKETLKVLDKSLISVETIYYNYHSDDSHEFK